MASTAATETMKAPADLSVGRRAACKEGSENVLQGEVPDWLRLEAAAMDSLTSAAAAAGWVAAAAAAAAAATVVVTVAPADGPAHGSARRSGWQAESIIAAPAEERRAAIVRRAQALARRRFAWEQVAARVDRVLRDVRREARSGGGGGIGTAQ